MEYSYPIDVDWSQEEIVQVVEFFNHIESAYETSVKKSEFERSYKNFKKIVPGKSDENNIYKEFKEASGYDGYKAVKALKDSQDGSNITVK
nr:UPF0223 family protein [Mammaliicoccus sp. Marseille-Q6498]